MLILYYLHDFYLYDVHAKPHYMMDGTHFRVVGQVEYRVFRLVELLGARIRITPNQISGAHNHQHLYSVFFRRKYIRLLPFLSFIPFCPSNFAPILKSVRLINHYTRFLVYTEANKHDCISFPMISILMLSATVCVQH